MGRDRDREEEGPEEDLTEDLGSDEIQEEVTGPVAPAQIWANVVPGLADALVNVHHCIQQCDWEAAAILDLAEALSDAIEKDVVDHPEWKTLDRKFRLLPEGYGEPISKAHFMARLRTIRELGRKYNVMGRKASQGDPAKFLSFASLCPKVK